MSSAYSLRYRRQPAGRNACGVEDRFSDCNNLCRYPGMSVCQYINKIPPWRRLQSPSPKIEIKVVRQRPLVQVNCPLVFNAVRGNHLRVCQYEFNAHRRANLQ